MHCVVAVHQFDRQWEKDAGFVFYDFNQPESIPESLCHSFDLLVIDPPFITEDVWRKYACSAMLLLKKGVGEDGVPLGKVILTTVLENERLLESLFGTTTTVSLPANLFFSPHKYSTNNALLCDVLRLQAFRPSIPHLVYQYNLFTNFPSATFSQPNPEVDW